MRSTGHSDLRFTKAKEEGQSRNFYDSHNYDRGNYQNRYRSNSGDRRIQFSRQRWDKLRYEQNYRRWKFWRQCKGYIKILEDRTLVENIEAIKGMKITVERERGVGPEKDHFQGIIIIIEGMIEA